MKKLSKFALGTALFLILSGGLLAVSGRMMGGHTSVTLNRYDRAIVVTPFGIRDIDHAVTNPAVDAVEAVAGTATESSVSFGAAGSSVSVGVAGSPVAVAAAGITETAVQDMESLVALDINVSMADVTVREGEAFDVALTWQDGRNRLYSEINDGVLVVRSEGDNHWSRAVEGGTVVVTYPAGTLFDEVHVNTDLGAIDLSGFATEQLNVSAGLGSADLAGVTAEDADFDLNMGALTATAFTVNGLLTVKNSMGGTKLEGTFHDMDLSADLGSIDVNTSLPQSQYRWDLSTDLGSVDLGGTAISADGRDGGDGKHSISAHSSMGGITLNFGS